MRFWRVSRDGEPNRAGRESDQRAQQKGRPPTVVQHDVRNKRRGYACADANSGKNNSIRSAAFMCWDPARDKLVGRWIHDCFAGAERKPKEYEHKHSVMNI